MKTTLIVAAAATAITLSVSPVNAQETQGPGVKETIKEDAKAAGHAVADASRKVGHEIADTSKKVGHEVADSSRKVGHEIAETSAPARETGKEDSKKAGAAVAHGAKQVTRASCA